MLTSLLKKTIEIVQMLSRKPKLTEVLMTLWGVIPQFINQVGAIADMDDKAKVDEALKSIDDFTGVDVGAFDLIRDLPAEKEEELFDHINEALRIMAYNRLKVRGYYIDPDEEPVPAES